MEALRRGWSADNIRGAVAAREELQRIAANADAFLASLIKKQGTGEPIPCRMERSFHGSLAIDAGCGNGEFCGSIGLRWQPGTEAHPRMFGYRVILDDGL